VNTSAELIVEVPPVVVTVTSTVPLAVTAWLTAVICVSLFTVKVLAGALPNHT
jgi:hypothetical protein